MTSLHAGTAGIRDWRAFFATELPERFFAFVRPILAPESGAVVDVRDGELDHEGRRSQLALVASWRGSRRNGNAP